MPSDETRRVLKVFGVAVTGYEDAIHKGASVEELSQAEGEVRARLEEVRQNPTHPAVIGNKSLPNQFES